MHTIGVGRSVSIDVGRFGAILEGLEQYEKPVGSTGLPALMFRKGSTQSKAILGHQNLLKMFNTTQGGENNQLGKSILECLSIE